ncbi:hypothetical protein ACFLVW_02735 [Chloroflexota bacterium]
MPEDKLRSSELTRKLKKNRKVVGLIDKVYLVTGRDVVFDEIQVLGDLSRILDYNGTSLRVVQIDTIIGLLVDNIRGARGPVWQKVRCEVVNV